jgi:hypothetical protein
VERWSFDSFCLKNHRQYNVCCNSYTLVSLLYSNKILSIPISHQVIGWHNYSQQDQKVKVLTWCHSTPLLTWYSVGRLKWWKKKRKKRIKLFSIKYNFLIIKFAIIYRQLSVCLIIKQTRQKCCQKAENWVFLFENKILVNSSTKRP